MSRLQIDQAYLVRVLEDLISTPSPTGDTAWVISFVQNELEAIGVSSFTTHKGALVAVFEGLRDTKPRALTAHVDTLGAMVASIKPSGRIAMLAINGVNWPTVESEGVTVRTRSGRQIRGSVVLKNGASHVNREASTMARTSDTLEVRLDERTNSAYETTALGVSVGDYIAFDPRFEASASGYVRSRFLDDKACVACLLAAVKAMNDVGVTPAQRTHILFSNFEEVGHGGFDGLPDDLAELLVLDMACVGEGQTGDEFHCSICLKDGGSPYSKDLSDRVIATAGQEGIELLTDVYRNYSSDGTAYWRAGGRAQVALIGPGVDTSHGYERTHVDALHDTAALTAAYLIQEAE